jgi:hypothetical protein
MKSVEPCVFGPIIWTILHLLSFSYDPSTDPQNEAQNMKNYILATGSVLPCGPCRDHFNNNINSVIGGQTLDQALGSSGSLQKFIYDFHNLVNQQTGKKNGPSFQDVYNTYDPLIKKNSCSIDSCHSDSNDVYCKIEFAKKESNIILNGIMFIGFLFVLYLIYYFGFKNRAIKTRR